MILRRLGHGGEIRIEGDGGLAALERGFAEIFKPAVRAFDAVESTMRAIWMQYRRALGSQISNDICGLIAISRVAQSSQPVAPTR